MNVGSGNYNTGMPSCTYKGKIVPCPVEFSERGGISGYILMNVLMHLDDLKWYDNDTENGAIPTLLVGVYVSRFDLFKKNTYAIKIKTDCCF